MDLYLRRHETFHRLVLPPYAAKAMMNLYLAAFAGAVLGTSISSCFSTAPDGTAKRPSTYWGTLPPAPPLVISFAGGEVSLF